MRQQTFEKRELYYIDGGCSGNNQKDVSKRVMTMVVTDDKGFPLEIKKKRGGSNNIAEFWALKKCLDLAFLDEPEKIKIITDSRNNLAWFKGHIGKKINDREAVFDLYYEIKSYKRIMDIDLEQVPREKNLAGVYLEENKEELEKKFALDVQIRGMGGENYNFGWVSDLIQEAFS